MACEHTARHHHGVGAEQKNVFTIIGVVGVIILVAGYFGVHSFIF
jgi:hypothetical protein